MAISTEVALGIDVGTGSTKAGLIDGTGRIVAVGRSPHVVAEPTVGWSETDPSVWLGAAVDAVGSALDAAAAVADGKRPDVVAIGFSGQMHGVVLCDSDMEPARPAVLWSDQRAQPFLDRLRSSAGADADIDLANPIVAGMAGSTIAAIAELEPSALAGTETILQAKDWVRYQLTGVLATDASDASATLLWDPSADDWSAAACERFGVSPSWLPPVMRSDGVAGTLTANASATFGLAAGVPVAVGAADTAAALLGAGIGIGETQLSTGTGGQIATMLSAPTIDRSGRTHLFRGADHPSGDAAITGSGDTTGPWYAMAAIQNAGIAIDWALGVLDADLADAERSLAASPVGANGVVYRPYLTGERTPHMDSRLTGGWTGLRPSTSRDDLIRSVFEGVAFALRDGLDALRHAGHRIDRALLAGGGSTAAWWQRLLADVLGIELVPHDAVDASVRGAGLLAWAAIGRAIEPGAGINRLASVRPGPDGGSYADALAAFRSWSVN